MDEHTEKISQKENEERVYSLEMEKIEQAVEKRNEEDEAESAVSHR